MENINNTSLHDNKDINFKVTEKQNKISEQKKNYSTIYGLKFHKITWSKQNKFKTDWMNKKVDPPSSFSTEEAAASN